MDSKKPSLFPVAPAVAPAVATVAPVAAPAAAPVVSDATAARRAHLIDVVIRIASELALGDRPRDMSGFAHAGAEAQIVLVGALIALARASRDPNAAIRRALEIIATADLTPIRAPAPAPAPAPATSTTTSGTAP